MSHRVTSAQQVNHHTFLSDSLDNGHAIGDGVDPLASILIGVVVDWRDGLAVGTLCLSGAPKQEIRRVSDSIASERDRFT